MLNEAVQIPIEYSHWVSHVSVNYLAKTIQEMATEINRLSSEIKRLDGVYETAFLKQREDHHKEADTKKEFRVKVKHGRDRRCCPDFVPGSTCVWFRKTYCDDDLACERGPR